MALIKIDVQYDQLLNYITYVNQTPFIQDLQLKNQSEDISRQLEVVIEFADNIADKWTQGHVTIEPHSSVSLPFDKNPIHFHAQSLYATTEGFSSDFTISVYQEKTLIHSETKIFLILAHNQWLGIHYQPRLIASFIVPNHPKIMTIIKRASDILRKWSVSFSAYQTKDKNDVNAQIKAIYLALQQEKINYVSAPPSFEESGQRVRLSNEVLDLKLGNCLELSLLFASCLEQVGLNALIVCLEGHAFVGCQLTDQTFPYVVNDDISLLLKRMASGIEDIVLLETTCLTSNENILFEEAMGQAAAQLANESNFIYALDIKKSRSLGVRPLPQENEMIQTSIEGETALPPIINAEKPKDIEERDSVELATKRKRSRLKTWESKLLNLTLRNNLLNFRPYKRSISIMEGNLDTLEDSLSSGEEFALIPCPEELVVDDKQPSEFLNSPLETQSFMSQELDNNRLVTLMDQQELDYAIKTLYYSSRSDLEENGANTLFLAIGFLKWFENDLSKQPRHAPILLYPIELIRKSSIKGYVIRFRDEDILLNTTLLEKMRRELNLEMPALDVLPTDKSGIDVKKILHIFRTAILHKPNWDVVEKCCISLFSFREFVMWNDLRVGETAIQEHPIISSLLDGVYLPDDAAIVDVASIDHSDFISRTAVLLDADSSQLSAIYSAANGSSFVLHGPPGTGKSQTITNIIATALYQGKSVLFVAEKMAALAVVQNRLEQVGLDDFVMELHSNKSRKSDILTRLEKTLDVERLGNIKGFEEKKKNLITMRDQLNENNQALHEELPNGYSLFDLIAKYMAVLSYDVEKITPLAIKKVSVSYMKELSASCDAYEMAFQQVGDVKNHALKRIKMCQLSLKQKETIYDLLTDLIDACKDTADSIDQELSDVAPRSSWNDSTQIIDVLYQLAHTNHLFLYYIQHVKTEKIGTDVDEIIASGKKMNHKKTTILNDFDGTIFALDAHTTILKLKQAKQQWFLPKMIGENKVIKQVKLYANHPKSVTSANISDTLEELQEISNLQKQIEEYMAIHQLKLTELWSGDVTDWDAFEKGVTSTRDLSVQLLDLHASVSSLDIDKLILNLTDNFQAFNHTSKSTWAAVKEKIETVSDQINQMNQAIQGEIIDPSRALADEVMYLETMKKSFSSIDRWVDYNNHRLWFEKEQLLNFIETVEEDSQQLAPMKYTLTKSLLYYCILDELHKNDSLKYFSATGMETLVSEYKKELKIVTQLTQLDLIEKLTINIPKPRGAVNIASELGILKKAIKSGGRGISLRKVFESAPNVIRSIAPCMLMSPISIAQYLDLTFPKFDLVIFDEASQVYTHTAVGAISRGKQLIVVGDPNQLPPTSFFQDSYEDDEESFEEIDQDSILDECQAASFPQLYLGWHYRSKHESLIAFSNSEYYDNRLFTFPSVDDKQRKVTLVAVEGFYDRGGTKENRAEALCVVAEIKRRLQHEELRQHSIGVVTFSSIQQRLVQNLLDDLYAHHPQLETYANEMKEAIFVKNLENVQGDERDVILFSIGYGPDKNKKVTMNFGPLNQVGGWKRLNVVISRSREEMIVYSVLKPEEIDLSRTSSKGVLGLKKFLEFASNRRTLAPTVSHYRDVTDDIVNSVAASLEEKNYTVQKNIGRSNFRIDIGIVDDKNPDEYIAAILIDGKNYHRTPTVRDRNVVQKNVLQNLGWSLITIWTVDWFSNKENVIQRVEAQLAQLKERKIPVQAPKEILEEPLEELMTIEYKKPIEKPVYYYEAHHRETHEHDKKTFYLATSQDNIRHIMDEIIRFEAPIVEEDLFRKVISAWGITGIGTKVREILEAASEKIFCFKLLDDDETVYWKSRVQYDTYEVFRQVGEERRPFMFICDTEIENTMLHVLEEQVSLDFDILCKEVFTLHGYQTLGQEAKSKIGRCLAHLEYKEMVIEENNRYLFAKVKR